MRTRVLVADDQAPFRLAARAVVQATADFELVAEARSGEEAILLVERLRPELVLMDIRMAGIGGIEAARRIALRRPATVTILVSTLCECDLPPEAGTCGAAGYARKSDFGPAMLRRVYRSAR